MPARKSPYDSIRISYYGQSLTVKQVCANFKLSRRTVYYRRSQGWSDNQIVETPSIQGDDIGKRFHPTVVQQFKDKVDLNRKIEADRAVFGLGLAV